MSSLDICKCPIAIEVARQAPPNTPRREKPQLKCALLCKPHDCNTAQSTARTARMSDAMVSTGSPESGRANPRQSCPQT